MKNQIDKLKSLKPKTVLTGLMKLAENHMLTMLIILAGILIGYALFSVSSLTRTASESSTVATGDVPAPISSLNIKEDTESALLALKQDENVNIGSNIATYRRSAFSSATSESDWVIEAAAALESFKQNNDYYPEENMVASTLRQANIVPEDSEERTLNSDGSDYSYNAERCENGRCQGFFLTAKVSGSIYQLGETDSIKRSWVNATAKALDAYNKSSTDRLYPTEADFISSMEEFYSDTLSDVFVATDPEEIDVNDEGSAYNYNGIDCTAAGCSSFVLRTTFKDGALYFQQSR